MKKAKPCAKVKAVKKLTTSALNKHKQAHKPVTTKELLKKCSVCDQALGKKCKKYKGMTAHLTCGRQVAKVQLRCKKLGAHYDNKK